MSKAEKPILKQDLHQKSFAFFRISSKIRLLIFLISKIMFIDGEGSCTGGSCNGAAGEEKKEGSCEGGECDGSHQA